MDLDDLFDVDPRVAGAAIDAHYEDPAPADMDIPTTHYGSADEWVRKFLLSSYRRRVSPKGQSSAGRWSASWWESTEAMQRIEALWRMWETVRADPAAISTWWINHLDPHMTVLLSTVGPFACSVDENRTGDQLPYSPPPLGMFKPDLQQ